MAASLFVIDLLLHQIGQGLVQGQLAGLLIEFGQHGHAQHAAFADVGAVGQADRGDASGAVVDDLGVAQRGFGGNQHLEIHRSRVMTKMQAPHLADLVRMAFVLEASEQRQRMAGR